MSVRVTYDHELGVLKQDLKEMARMVESAIEQTFAAFEDQDYAMAEDVIKGDRTVNDMERAIESRCLSPDPQAAAGCQRPASGIHRPQSGDGPGTHR